MRLMREKLSYKQVLTQTQKLMLTQTLRQSLEILNYSTQELKLFLQYKQQEKPILTIRTRTPLTVPSEVINKNSYNAICLRYA